MNLIGTTLNNYTFEQEIGEGGMANVFVATHNTLKQKVAIKVLNENYVHNRNVRNRFLAEGRNMAAMSHTNVVKVFDLIDAGDVCAIVMEYIEGITLEEQILQNFPYKEVQLKGILEQMLEALDYIHGKGFVHRDVKPSNFMITKDHSVKLLDFGIAKDTNADNVDYTRTGLYQQMGSPIYMSPEQIESTKNVDAKTDIYSLGVVLYQMAKGKKPYVNEGHSLPVIQMKIIQEALPLTNTVWDSYITKATKKAPSERYASAKAWLAELNKQEDKTIVDQELIRREVSPQPIDKKKYINKGVFYAITGGLAFIILVLFLLRNLGASDKDTTLNSSVLMEEGLQIAVENEFSRGQEKYYDLAYLFVAGSCPSVQNKAIPLFKAVKRIDSLAAIKIKFLDDLKIELLRAAGEDVTTIGMEESIVIKSYNPREPLIPSRMHIKNIQKKGQSVRMTKSKELWGIINIYRKELTELLASSQITEPGCDSFYFNAPEINTYLDFKDLNNQIDSAINASNVSMDDREAIKMIYGALTKPAEIDGKPYFEYAFDRAPLVSAIGILTSLQKEILTARAHAVSLIRSRVGGCY
jgi:tRNA A-37 threonylcarbamoyl transferase component Bud32